MTNHYLTLSQWSSTFHCALARGEKISGLRLSTRRQNLHKSRITLAHFPPRRIAFAFGCIHSTPHSRASRNVYTWPHKVNTANWETSEAFSLSARDRKDRIRLNRVSRNWFTFRFIVDGFALISATTKCNNVVSGDSRAFARSFVCGEHQPEQIITIKKKRSSLHSVQYARAYICAMDTKRNYFYYCCLLVRFCFLFFRLFALSINRSVRWPLKWLLKFITCRFRVHLARAHEMPPAIRHRAASKYSTHTRSTRSARPLVMILQNKTLLVDQIRERLQLHRKEFPQNQIEQMMRNRNGGGDGGRDAQSRERANEQNQNIVLNWKSFLFCFSLFSFYPFHSRLSHLFTK